MKYRTNKQIKTGQLVSIEKLIYAFYEQKRPLQRLRDCGAFPYSLMILTKWSQLHRLVQAGLIFTCQIKSTKLIFFSQCLKTLKLLILDQ
jgi:hypothetical protein